MSAMVMRTGMAAVLAMVGVVAADFARAQGSIVLVDDIDATPTPFVVDEMVSLRDRVVVAGTAANQGTELWATAGEPEDLRLLLGIPGSAARSPSHLTRAGDAVFFSARDDAYGFELWRTEGSPETTKLVADLYPGPQGSNPESLVAVGDAIYFIARRASGSREIWRSDGTPGGTRPLTSFGSISVSPPVPWNGGVLWTRSSSGGHELGFTDGTEEGLLSIASLPSALGETTVTARGVLFSMYSPELGYELWATDATPEGTGPIADLYPGPASSRPGSFTQIGDVVYFGAVDDVSGFELWRTDGTASGTHRVADLRSGPQGSQPVPLGSLGDRLLFLADDGSGFALFSVDRDDDVVRRLATVPYLPPAASEPRPKGIEQDGVLYFSAAPAGSLTRSLWRTDGTAEGTQQLIAIDSSFRPMLPWRGGVLFGATLGWTDGTPEGTANLYPNASGRSGGFSPLADLGDTLLFRASRPDLTNPLWRTQGSPRTTSVLREFAPGPFAISGAGMRLGGKALFFADDGEHGLEPWESDGTPEGTRLLLDLAPGPAGSGGNGFLPGDGALYFVATPTPDEVVLYRTDGTAAGTTAIFRFAWLPAGEAVQDLSVDGDRLYFTTSRPPASMTLWISDYTAAGTTPLRTWSAQPTAARAKLVRIGHRVFFAADDGVTGSELWTSDGTSEGTRRVVDLRAGAFGSGPANLIAVGDLVVFEAYTTATGYALFRSDGTASGTFSLGARIGGESMAVAGEELFFTGFDALHSTELWVTNGSLEGTRLVRDIRQMQGSSPSGITAVGDGVIFSACDDETACEPWWSDGTEEGTIRLADLAPGTGSSHPSHFFPSGDLVYFAADHPVLGREPFALIAGPAPACRNGRDDDGDGLTDYPQDRGCWSLDAAKEDPACDDGTDDDGDGAADWSGAGLLAPDADCLGFPYRDSESGATCGIGQELVLVLASLRIATRRMRRRHAARRSG